MDRPPRSEIIRWVTPAAKVIEKVMNYRNRLKSSSAASSSTSTASSQPPIAATFLGIVRDTSVQDTNIISRQYHQISVGVPLHRRLHGLKIPENVFRNGRNAWIEVYLATEKICRQLNIRIHIKTRARRKMRVESSGCTQSLEKKLELMDVNVMETGEAESTPPSVSQPESLLTVGSTYDTDTTIVRSTELLYNNCSYSSKTDIHGKIMAVQMSGGGAKSLLRSWQPPVKKNVCNLTVPPFSTKELDEILRKISQFHEKLCNLNLFVRSCTKFWVKKEESKALKRKQRIAASSSKIQARNSTKVNSFSQPVNQQSSKNAGTVDQSATGLLQSISHSAIIATVSQILHKSGASELLGSNANNRVFLRFLRRFILFGGTKCSLPVSFLVKRLKPEGCKWLPSTICLSLKIHYLAKAAEWLLQEYVLPILRWAFYVTEKSDTRYQIHFFLKDSWATVTQRLQMQYVKKKYIVPLRRKNAIVNSRLRFVPKSSGKVRSILACKKDFKNHAKSYAGKLLLSYVSFKNTPHGIDDGTVLEEKWAKFLHEWRGKGSPTLFFVKTDIKDAYPSVKISKLLDILNQWCSIEEKLFLLSYKSQSGITKFVWNSAEDPPQSQRKPWRRLRRSGTSDFNYLAALEEIKTVLKSPVVGVGKEKYRFQHGLPQGWQLSSLLCNVYYGHMDKKHFGEFLNVPGELFVRNIDDYCFISPDPNRVSLFYEKLRQGIGEYNCHFNETKTKHNLSVSSVNDHVPCFVKFVGWNLCLGTGHVSRDFDSYAGIDVTSTQSYYLTPNMTSEYAMTVINKRLRHTASLRIQSILFNPKFNCRPMILTNAFEAGLMAAFRFYAMCRMVLPEMTKMDCKTVVSSVYCSICSCAVSIARVIMRHITRSSSVRQLTELHLCRGDSGCHCHESIKGCPVNIISTTTKTEIVYVVISAFVMKLKRHKGVFKRNLLPILNFKLRKLAEQLDDDQKILLTSITWSMPKSFAAMKK